MIALLVLAGCWQAPEELWSDNELVQETALEELPAWKARRLVPELTRIADETDGFMVKTSAYRALVRADTNAAEAVLREHLARDQVSRYHVLNALEQVRTKRSCDLMAEIFIVSVSGPETDEQKGLRGALESTRLDDGWPCFQSLRPYRATSPVANAMWEEASRKLGP